MYDNLLWIFKKKKDFLRFKDLIKPHVVPNEITILVESMDQYFKSNPTISEINYHDFIPWFKLKRISSLSKEKHFIYDKMFESLLGDEPEEDELKNTLGVLLDKDYAIKIADYLVRISEGDYDKDILDVEDFIKDYKTETDRTVADKEDLFVTDDPTQILVTTMSEGLEWRLEELNISCGPLRKGNFAIIGASVNVGKTTMLASEATHMASQLRDDKVVVWFNNEEEGTQVKSRIWQAALGWSRKDCDASPLKTVEEVKKLWSGRIDRIKLVDDKNITAEQVEEILDSLDPGLIIFDQLFKIQGFNKAFSEVDKQLQLFSWGRSIAHKYAPVITVHQADGTAVGEKYPGMHQLYNSRVGVQGEADLIITIGMDLDPSASATNNERGIHICKNKLPGGPRSEEEKRHWKWDVDIEPIIARYKGSF